MHDLNCDCPEIAREVYRYIEMNPEYLTKEAIRDSPQFWHDVAQAELTPEAACALDELI